MLLASYVFCLGAAADTVSTWNGGGGNWSNAAQWTPAVIPNNSNGQSYDVTIPSSGYVAFDYDSTINSLALNGTLVSGDVQLPYPPTALFTLTVNGNVMQNGSIFDGVQGFSEPYGLIDQVVVGGNFNNKGSSVFEGGLSVAGTLVNSGGLQTLTYTNSIPLVINSNVTIGKLVNSGTMDLDNTSTKIGVAGTTVQNSGNFNIGSFYSNPTVNVAGNFSNSGNVAVSYESNLNPLYGPSSLVVNGTLTNQASGTFSVYNGLPAQLGSAPGTLIAQNFINYATATFLSSAASSVQQLSNYGTVNVDTGQLNVATLKAASGYVNVNSAALLVGSGNAAPGFIGYEQFANGVLDYSGGQLSVNGSTILDGTLDIMLGQGYQPIGTVYAIFPYLPGGLSGSFSNVQGLVFDNGQERYLLSYDSLIGPAVTLTVEANVTPEPASVCLFLLGAGSVLTAARARSRRRLS